VELEEALGVGEVAAADPHHRARRVAPAHGDVHVVVQPQQHTAAPPCQIILYYIIIFQHTAAPPLSDFAATDFPLPI
jgi:hypothetical protein